MNSTALNQFMASVCTSLASRPYLYAFTVILLLPLYRISFFHPLHGIPGPILFRMTELPMFFLALRGTRHLVVRGLHEKYGQAVRIAPNTVSFTSQSAITQIYGSAQAFDKTSAYDLHSIKGKGLLFIKDRASHVLRRRIWNRSFSKEALAGYQGPIVSQVENLVHWLLERTKTNGMVDLVRILPQYTFDSTNAVFFSGNAFHPSLLDFDDKNGLANSASGYLSAFEFFSHAQRLFHVTKYMPWISAFSKFESFATEAARRYLAKGSTFKDGISYWFEGNDDRAKLQLEDLPIESETALLGGSDTLGSMATFICFFMLTRQEWFAILREELDSAFPDRHLNDALERLDELPLLNVFIQETLRLGAPFPGLPRIVPKGGIIINGHHVPGGTCVSVPIWTHHTDERYFPEPYKFNPERWLEDGKFKPSRNPIFTFSSGPFNCVGSKLVYVQLRILAAFLVLRLDFALADGFSPAEFWEGIRNCRATTFVQPLYVKVSTRRI